MQRSLRQRYFQRGEPDEQVTLQARASLGDGHLDGRPDFPLRPLHKASPLAAQTHAAHPPVLSARRRPHKAIGPRSERVMTGWLTPTA